MLSSHAFASPTPGSLSLLPPLQSKSLYHEAGLLFAFHMTGALLPGYIPRHWCFFAKTYSETCTEARSIFAEQWLRAASKEQE